MRIREGCEYRWQELCDKWLKALGDEGPRFIASIETVVNDLETHVDDDEVMFIILRKQFQSYAETNPTEMEDTFHFLINILGEVWEYDYRIFHKP